MDPLKSIDIMKIFSPFVGYNIIDDIQLHILLYNLIQTSLKAGSQQGYPFYVFPYNFIKKTVKELPNERAVMLLLVNTYKIPHHYHSKS